MIPILFRIGPLEIPSYGVCLALGILLAWFFFNRQFKTAANKDELASLITYAVVAGFLGSRLNYILEHTEDIGSWSDLFHMIFSRSGLTVYGGLIAGVLFAIFYCRKHEIAVLPVLDAGAPAICIGYFFGRLGCQLSGDGDYGKPSTLPWAMAYPNGTVPTLERVHPAPVYEMILYAVIFCILLWYRRKKPAPGKVFSLFLILAGLERFGIEWIRLNRPVFLGLTEAQLVSVAVAIMGVILFLKLPSAVESPQSKRIRAGTAG
ncbi:MAG TPA: prolipoprotein diacylglyceryl transferase [Acidobacteriota bacterium]|nr:prolipoprotein diacylglyceryl transferase [Acidobacteriota bacterium]